MPILATKQSLLFAEFTATQDKNLLQKANFIDIHVKAPLDFDMDSAAKRGAQSVTEKSLALKKCQSCCIINRRKICIYSPAIDYRSRQLQLEEPNHRSSSQ